MLSGSQPGRDAAVPIDQSAGRHQMVGVTGRRGIGLAVLLQRLAEPAMEIEPARPTEPLVDHLPDQRVWHCQATSAVLDEEPRRDRMVGGIEQAIPVEPAGGNKDRERRCLTGDGGEVEHLHHDRVEPIEAHAEHVANRVREVGAGLASGVPDQFGEEEGIAAGGSPQLGGPDGFLPVQLEQRADLSRAERVDRDARRTGRPGRAWRRPGPVRASGHPPVPARSSPSSCAT